MSNAPGSQTIQVKKYPNRRFYDVTHSRHVTLQDLYEFVRTGQNIAVTDSRTGNDITSLVLMQIILEHDPPKMSLFGSHLLHQVIQANQQILRTFVDNYFGRALDAFIHSQQQFEQLLRQTGVPVPQLTATNPLNWARTWLGQGSRPADAPREDESAAPRGEPVPPPPPPDESPDLKQTVNDLQRELAEMRRQLTATATRRGRKPKIDKRK